MPIVRCSSCGKQYEVAEQHLGRRVRCKECGAEFEAAADSAETLFVDDVPGDRVADEIDYEVYGDDLQFVEVTLDPDEQVIAEAGAMMYMSAGIRMETVLGNPAARGQGGGGFWGKVAAAGKRVITGESLFMTTFTNSSRQREQVAFGAPYPGRIVPLHLDELGGEIIAQKGAFLCGARGLQIGIAFQKKIMTGLFGGEGFIMQRIQGDGIALMHAGGTLHKLELEPGQTVKLDTGCLAALSPSVTYDIEFVGGIKNTFFGGEGLFLATLRGPGGVWVQSLPFSRLAGRIFSAAPQTGGARKGEGSVLDWVGGLGNMLDGD